MDCNMSFTWPAAAQSTSEDEDRTREHTFNPFSCLSVTRLWHCIYSGRAMLRCHSLDHSNWLLPPFRNTFMPLLSVSFQTPFVGQEEDGLDRAYLVLSLPEPKYRASAVTWGESGCRFHPLSSLLESLKGIRFSFFMDRVGGKCFGLEWGQTPATEGPSELWVLFGREVGVVTATTITYPDSYRKETCYYL